MRIGPSRTSSPAAKKPATVHHRASGAANAAADGCGEEGAASGKAFLQYSCRGMAVTGGGCGDQLASAAAPLTATAGMSGASTGIPRPLRLRARIDRRQDQRRKGVDTWVCSHAWRSVRICCATMFSLRPRLPLTTV